ncbi:MAG: hypothetical protein H0W90_11775 [Actinobacteria bacterium]|nr:hypothetical protein [Actinomycetota bacterium]
MALLPEQEELLVTLVEAARKVPRHQQQFMHMSFTTDQQIGSMDSVIGDAIDGQLQVLGSDMVELSAHRYIRYGSHAWGDSAIPFTITADGFHHYEALRDRSKDTLNAVEEEVQRYLDGTFAERFPAAYERLQAAEQMLWQSDPSPNFTTIGHKLREAVQQFATAMLDRHGPEDVDGDPTKTKNRLRAVIEMRREELGTAKTSLLQALIDYQDAVNEMVQRQEHGDQKPGGGLTFEDARAAVFQTAMLLHEYDRLLNRP